MGSDQKPDDSVGGGYVAGDELKDPMRPGAKASEMGERLYIRVRKKKWWHRIPFISRWYAFPAFSPAGTIRIAAAVHPNLRRIEQNHKFRGLLFAVVTVLVILVVFASVAFMIVFLWLRRENAEGSVLIAWFSASVVQVIGLMAILARNLFPAGGDDYALRTEREPGVSDYALRAEREHGVKTSDDE